MNHQKQIRDVLKVENISLSFGGVKALNNISFDVKEHEIRSIIGPNGAGERGQEPSKIPLKQDCSLCVRSARDKRVSTG